MTHDSVSLHRTLAACVLAALVALVPTEADAQECPPASATGQASAWWVEAGAAVLSRHTNSLTALRAAQDSALARGDTVYVRAAYRVVCPAEAPEDTTTSDTTTTDPEPDDTTDGTHDGTDDTTEDPVASEPAVVFDPDQYSSTEDLLQTASPFGGAELKEDGSQGQIHLDTEVAPPGGSQSMRYDYIDQGVGNSLHVGRRMPLPSSAREVWIEAQVRWSTNFFAIRDFPQDGSTFAHKFLFGEAKAFATDPNWETSEGWSVNRWSLLFPGGGSPNPPNGPITIQTPRHDDGSSIVENQDRGVAEFYDAQWHTVRLHWRSDPGLYELWIDGERIVQREGFTIHPEVVMTAILLGRNKDDGLESGTESLWWGRTSVWTEDPGW
jgi:hypothetical protein